MTHDNLPDEPFSFVGAPTPRRRLNMNPSILRLALFILGAGFLLCLGGIIWLSADNPARPIPDVLVGTTMLIVGAIVGVLVPTKAQ